MVDIALDPNMYYFSMSVPDTLRKARELGYDNVELSPTRTSTFGTTTQRQMTTTLPT